MMTSRYGTPVIAARIKAATPITGGMIDPPDEAAASMPPANTREKPRCIIIGIVRTPVDNTLTTGPPVIVPNMAELTIAACAGPPRRRRVQRKASLISVLPPADFPKRAPRMIYGNTTFMITCMKRPRKPDALFTSASCTFGTPSRNDRGSPPSLVI